MNNTKRLIVLGRLGSNPELKYTQKQEPVCTFSIAENVPDSEKPIWHKIVVWGKQAEQCSVHLSKGASVFVQGQNRENEYTNSDGETKKYIELRANVVGISLQ